MRCFSAENAQLCLRMPKSPPSATAVCATAILSLAIAMGIGRFAFTPMLPLMIREGGLPLDGGAWLAATNYLGYLVGALTAARLPGGAARGAAAGLAGIVATTAAMAATRSLPLWVLLRGAAGLFSGWALVGVSAWSLFHLARLRRPALAGWVYAGVGLGIVVAGLVCLAGGAIGARSPALWLTLGALACAAAVQPLSLLRGGPGRAPRPAQGSPTSRGLVVPTACYGTFGFGYILPATYLPALARHMIDDPVLFGLVWPVFGVAAMFSTVLAGLPAFQSNRLRGWAIAQLAMAAGTALPAAWTAAWTLGAAALLIGGTFMVITMLGMQEARARAGDNATAAMGRMTAVFAVGQFAGPLTLVAAPAGSLAPALELAALCLAASALVLWLLSRRAAGSSLRTR